MNAVTLMMERKNFTSIEEKTNTRYLGNGTEPNTGGKRQRLNEEGHRKAEEVM